MAEHNIQVEWKDMNRYTNDEPYHTDDEYYMLYLLQNYWKTDNTQDISPRFYLTDKQISHDLASAPAIVVYQSNKDSIGLGISYPAERLKITMHIDVFTLDRTMLFDVGDEIKRILLFCRKRPMPEWDFIYTISERRLEPRAGNYRFMFVVEIYRLAKPIPDSAW